MRRASWVAALSLVGVLGWSVSASATTIVTFTGVNGNDGTYYDQNLGAYVYAGIYTGTINGGPTVSFICDDFLSEIWGGDSWNANVSNVGSSLSAVKFLGGTGGVGGTWGTGGYHISNTDLKPGGAACPSGAGSGWPGCVSAAGLTQQDEYEMIDYLVNLMFIDGSNGHYANWASEAGAIWSIADGGWNSSSYTINNGGSHTAQYFVGQALAYEETNPTSFPKYSIYTPTAADQLVPCTGPNQSGCDGQEFWGPYQPTPEPTLAALLSVTFLGVGLLGKRVFGESRV